jgi:hypothetical protein
MAGVAMARGATTNSRVAARMVDRFMGNLQGYGIQIIIEEDLLVINMFYL